MRQTKSKKEESKSCFIIMPISDMDGYEKGHFTRVYEHLIKPACKKAGFTPIRADDVDSSNFIVIGILSKIVESNMVLCDLSGTNPNVLYELGIRQAFNLPTVLINDNKTDKIFDIQGLRYTEYNQSLRIDSVEKQIQSIASSLKETEKAQGNDINSLIQLLGIQAATKPSKVELSTETSVVLSAIKDLSNRISTLEIAKKQRFESLHLGKHNYINQIDPDSFIFNDDEFRIGNKLYIFEEEIGILLDATKNYLVIEDVDGDVTTIYLSDDRFHHISKKPAKLPF